MINCHELCLRVQPRPYIAKKNHVDYIIYSVGYGYRRRGMEESKLRKRAVGGDGKSTQGNDGEETCRTQSTATEQKSVAAEEVSVEQSQMQSGTYWLTRIVFTRSLGLVYCKS